MPIKPIKASESKPATSSEIGTPCIPFGMFASSNCSLILENIIIANPNPTEIENAKTTAFNKFVSGKPIASRATPRTAQLVVINGKNTPRA